MLKNIKDYAGQHIHFIGIGGSSMSGLARLLHSEGYVVSGSDNTRSHKTDALRDLGIPVFIGHSESNIQGADLIVYSAAIADDNPERTAARINGIPQLERCDLIGQLMENYPFAVAISGTHGKTTTTSMVSQMFLENGMDPTIHIGGELDFIGGSTRRGSSDDFIVEACEYHDSFLRFHPTVAVILNIDEDHLDYFKDLDAIEESFHRFAALVPPDGWCIAWGEDPRAKRVCLNAACRHITYGEGAENDVRAVDLRYDDHGCAVFKVVTKDGRSGDFHLGVPGEVNLLDALAAISVAYVRGIDLSIAAKALAEFTGAHRRCEHTCTVDGVKCYTDYGHNPAEIQNAIAITSLQPHRELWSVWQPHTYSRTKTLFQSFLETFDAVDHLLITDICAARESDPGDIASEMLISPLRQRGVDAVLTPTFDDAERYLREHWKEGDVMVSHGCGDIYLLNEQIALHGDTVS